MNRYLLNIAYIGTRFRGIQKIKAKADELPVQTDTIQGSIELALKTLHPANDFQTVLSSRTDAGVHALHSTLHVDLQRHDNLPYETNAVTALLNRTLSRHGLPIRVLSTERVPDTFHSRYHACGRTYLYRIAVAKKPTLDPKSLRSKGFEEFVPVEEINRCHFMQKVLFDIERCKAASQMFVGRHDFRTFMTVNKSRDHPMFAIRHISEIDIRPGKSLAVGENGLKADELYNYWDIFVTGKSFLYKQVRRIVGTLIAVATNRIDEKCIYEMLTIPSKHSWDPRVVPAPPTGLYLCRVHYDPKDLQI